MTTQTRTVGLAVLLALALSLIAYAVTHTDPGVLVSAIQAVTA